jgi:hypothetical protein
MWNPVEKLQQWRARRRYVPRSPRHGAGTTAKLALVALVLIIVAAAVLEMRGGGAAERTLLPYATAAQVTPADLIATAGRRHRLLFLADIHGAAGPKVLAAEAVETLAGGSGLDALVVEIPADEQPYLDRYFLTAPEDASILLGRPRAVREASGVSRSYLELYRTVYRVNTELGADRAVRVIAADVPEWPPTRARSPNEAGAVYGSRDAFMAARVDSMLLALNARARVLFFVDGLHTLRGGATLHSGGTGLVEITWLAERLAQRYPRDVYGILVDASVSRALAPALAAYRRTGAADVFRGGRGSLPRRFGLPVTSAFDAIGDPVHVTVTPGTTFGLQPGGELTALADGYVYLGN